jgi:hypothetical protein
MVAILHRARRVWMVLACSLCASAPVLAQPSPMLVLQADLLGRRNSEGAPPTAVGLTGGAEWRRAAVALGVKATVLYSPASARGRSSSDAYPDVLQAFPHVDVGVRVLERGRVRINAIGAAGPWINVASRSRDESGRLRSFGDVEYRAAAASAGAEICWTITAMGRRICGSGSTLHLLPGFGRRDGGFVGPLYSVSVTR